VTVGLAASEDRPTRSSWACLLSLLFEDRAVPAADLPSTRFDRLAPSGRGGVVRRGGGCGADIEDCEHSSSITGSRTTVKDRRCKVTVAKPCRGDLRRQARREVGESTPPVFAPCRAGSPGSRPAARRSGRAQTVPLNAAVQRHSPAGRLKRPGSGPRRRGSVVVVAASTKRLGGGGGGGGGGNSQPTARSRSRRRRPANSPQGT